MRRLAVIFVAGFICICGGLRTFACTTFVLQGGDRIYLGRNLDWGWEDGLVLVNARHVRKIAFVAPDHVPAKWTSKYESVTFNQFGRELPFGGMNEAGLVVENMWLDGTQYPPADARPEINMLQWIQYQLDNYSTVAEVVGSDQQIRLENTAVRARIHYLVCDAQGDCATIEFLNGAMRVHRGGDLPYRALANDTYERATAYLRAHPPRKGAAQPFFRTGSLARFCRAAARANEFKPAKIPAQDLDYAFDTLSQVRQGKFTVWQIVYDISTRQIHFRTRSNPQKRQVDFKTLDFACTRPTQYVDIQANASSSGVLEFHELSEAEHQKYVEHFFAQKSLKRTVGDMTSMVKPLLLTLRGYTCADQ